MHCVHLAPEAPRAQVWPEGVIQENFLPPLLKMQSSRRCECLGSGKGTLCVAQTLVVPGLRVYVLDTYLNQVMTGVM